jgi:high-affinity Fe2+/Pb2+ permease
MEEILLIYTNLIENKKIKTQERIPACSLTAFALLFFSLSFTFFFFFIIVFIYFCILKVFLKKFNFFLFFYFKLIYF